MRARDLFYAMWTPDLFMKRVEAECRMDANVSKRMSRSLQCHGDEFDALYTKYEREGKGRKPSKHENFGRKY